MNLQSFLSHSTFVSVFFSLLLLQFASRLVVRDVKSASNLLNEKQTRERDDVRYKRERDSKFIHKVFHCETSREPIKVSTLIVIFMNCVIEDSFVLQALRFQCFLYETRLRCNPIFISCPIFSTYESSWKFINEKYQALLQNTTTGVIFIRNDREATSNVSFFWHSFIFQFHALLRFHFNFNHVPLPLKYPMLFWETSSWIKWKIIYSDLSPSLY